MPSPRTHAWLALIAAFLGWLFDGFEMGIFSVIAKPALGELLGGPSPTVDAWYSIIQAGFLIGAAAGGVLFGWLGDRFGRIRAMSLSVLTYALCTGLCGLSTAAWQLGLCRFVAALGMGGEWALGVALVMEVWARDETKSRITQRAWLAGIIGSSANLGFGLVALVSVGLVSIESGMRRFFTSVGLPVETIDWLLRNNCWRMLMLVGISPALLLFFFRLFVPESDKWLREKELGKTSHWSTIDLWSVLVGTGGAGIIILSWYPWQDFQLHLLWKILLTLLGFSITLSGYLYPARQYLIRAAVPSAQRWLILKRMMLAAVLSGIPLIGTWASIQWAPYWVNKVVAVGNPTASGWTQFWSALGASFGTIVAALLGDWLGRRLAYCCLCLCALLSCLLFYQWNTQYNTLFLVTMFLAGFWVGSFYGWIPLYFPELFPTAVRAIGQGFGYNFGRVIAAIATLQTGNLVTHVFQNNLANACSAMACVFLVGLVVIWFAPETKGQGLPE